MIRFRLSHHEAVWKAEAISGPVNRKPDYVAHGQDAISAVYRLAEILYDELREAQAQLEQAVFVAPRKG
jgi:hypothetical protein